MSTSNFDLVVCGGGVIGLSIAYQCVKEGWKVCVVERGKLGQASSWAGAGIFPSGALTSPLDPIEQLRALSHPLHAIWAKELLELTGIDNEYRPCGGLYLARTAAENATLVANTLWFEDHQIPYERWNEEQAKKRVPVLADSATLRQFGLQGRAIGTATNRPQASLPSYWWMPNDCRVRNPLHIEALSKALEILGVTILENCEVSQVLPDKEMGFQTRLANSQSLHSTRVCIATGAWTQQLLEPLGIHTGVLPVRGQMLLYKADEPLFTCVVNDGHRYLMPRDDGHILAGSCEEEVGFDNSTTPEMLAELQDWAQSVVPVLKSLPLVKSWAGLRPGSFDAYPYLGEAPGFRNLFIASGHFRHGLHWSTGTALLMQQLMSGQKTSINLEPFRIMRGLNSKV